MRSFFYAKSLNVMFSKDFRLSNLFFILLEKCTNNMTAKAK